MYGLSIIRHCSHCIFISSPLFGLEFGPVKRIKNQEDYLLAGRSFGKLIQTFASFGQATSADGPVARYNDNFKNGAAGIWSSLLMVFSTPSVLDYFALVATHAHSYNGRFLRRTLWLEKNGRHLCPYRHHWNDGFACRWATRP
jgi:hypothetical protein